MSRTTMIAPLLLLKLASATQDPLWRPLTSSGEGHPQAHHAQCYAERYPDLYAAFCPRNACNVASLHHHWTQHGQHENRIFHCGGPSSPAVRKIASATQDPGVALSEQRAHLEHMCQSHSGPDKAALERTALVYLEHLYHAEADPAGRAAEVDKIQKRMTGWDSGRTYKALKMGLNGVMNPLDRFCGNDWPDDGFGMTMIGTVRLLNVATLLHSVVAEGVPGAFAELGVWRGGACIFSRKVLDLFGQASRPVHVFDAFENIPGYGGPGNYLENSEEFVKDNFRREGVLSNTVLFHKGLFKDSVPKFREQYPPAENPIAVLRVDGNFYDSYQDAMYYLYEHVPVGGFVIFDDYFSHPAVQLFWRDFKADQGVSEELTRIDHHSGYFQKIYDVRMDMSRMHPPRDANK